MKSKPAIGRRKTSVAQVRLKPGKGVITINRREFQDYFPIDVNRITVMKPLEVTENIGKFDIDVTVRGGGSTGQTGAVQLGIARALVEFNEELKAILRKNDLLTRDPRMVERKKYGQKKARKRFQFSKR